MGYGFLAGAGMTGLLVASASPKDGTFFNGSERDLALVAGAVIIVPGTTLIGTLVGLCLKSESWEKVNLTSLRARIQPLHSGGLALSASFGF